MSEMPELLPCPFCGGGETEVRENRMTPRMDGTSTLISADLRHWCAPEGDGYTRGTIHIRAHDKASAATAWNRRADPHEALRRERDEARAEAERLREALRELEAALRKDSRGKSVIGDGVEYHLDGQAMYRAIILARAALRQDEGEG